MAENIKISDASKKYWAAVLEVIDAAGNYAAALKLYANLADNTTAWQVKPVLDKYYEGKMSNLKDAILYRKDLFNAKVNKLNILCMQNDIRAIKSPDRLLKLLLDPKRRRSYRDKAIRRLNKNKICPLQDFEAKK